MFQSPCHFGHPLFDNLADLAFRNLAGEYSCALLTQPFSLY